MKKPGNPKNNSAKKSTEKGKDASEVKKTTLKPLKEKEKKSWKNNLNEEDDEDFSLDDDLNLDSDFEDEEDDDYYDDDKY